MTQSLCGIATTVQWQQPTRHCNLSKELGNPASLSGQRAEALLCRAYSMYRLATTFCMAYNPDKADE